MYIIPYFFHKDWSVLGVYPLKLKGLIGIVTMPLVHGSWEHLLSNSLPLIVLLSVLYNFYKSQFYFILGFIWITTGIWLWLFGRSAWHIGASGVVFGLFAYVLFAGILSRKIQLIAISLMVWFLYAGSLWGIFPGKIEISWEGHLLGFLSGTLLAIYHYFMSKKRIVKDYDFSSEFLYSTYSLDIKMEYNKDSK